MPNLPWYTVEKGIQILRKTGMLEWIYHVRPAHLPGDGPDTPSTATVRNIFMKRASASLKRSVITLLCRPDLTVRTAALKLGNLNVMGVTGTKW